jgi:hypothetical protein
MICSVVLTIDFLINLPRYLWVAVVVVVVGGV